MMANNFSTFTDKFYFRKLIPTTSTSMSEDCISDSQNSNQIGKEGKNSKDRGTFSILKKQSLVYPKSILKTHLNINSHSNKFVSISQLIKRKVDIFLINGTQLNESFPDNQFAMSSYKFIKKYRSNFRGWNYFLY